ncbi:MAG: hypothetical protein JWR78_1597 [Mycobacterium sp.]|nr:hypothetical protein [Mycobacterium sp.]
MALRSSCMPADDNESVDAYEWTAFLDLLIGNKRRTVKTMNDGKPFVLVKRDRRPTVWV